MVFLVEKECKFSSLLIILFAIPIVVNIHEILSFWLKEIPAYTETLCQFILIAFMCDQLTLGLHVAKQSIGRIGAYTVLFYTPKVLILPVAYWMLNEGGSLTNVMWVYLIIEIIMAVLRTSAGDLGQSPGFSGSPSVGVFQVCFLCQYRTLNAAVCSSNMVDYA